MINTQEISQELSEQKLLLPLTQVLTQSTQQLIEAKPHSLSPSSTEAIRSLFPEQEYEEKNIQKAKEALGALADNFSKDEVRDLASQVEYLVESWLDEFERDIFKGQTLNELLHERRGL